MRAEADSIVFELVGDVHAEVVRHLLDLAAAEDDTLPVEIDLGSVSSLSEEAAALLLFRARGDGLPRGATLRTTNRPGRLAVVRAYAERRLGHAEVP